MGYQEGLEIVNALDGNAGAVGRTLYTNNDTASYKSVESTLTTDTEFDFFTQLGRFASAGYIINDDNTNSVGVKFSVDGTTYGDEITLKSKERLNFNVMIAFKKIVLLHTNNVVFRMVVR